MTWGGGDEEKENDSPVVQIHTHVVVVRLSQVVVEDHDGGDHAGGHHEHDAVEISAWRGTKGQIKMEVRCLPPPPRCC